MFEFLASIDPTSLPLWAALLFSASMYPLGFLFGACSQCCCNTESCDGVDLSAAYDRGCQLEPIGFGPYGSSTQSDDYKTQEATQLEDMLRFGVNPPANLTECSGIFGTPWVRRRSCIRFLCRCYESTGERANENADPASWYTVVSTSEQLGGPTTNGLNLESALDSAMYDGVSVEQWLFNNEFQYGDFTNQQAGARFCMLWVFSFWGYVADCETTYTGTPTKHEPRDDRFGIYPCTRCV